MKKTDVIIINGRFHTQRTTGAQRYAGELIKELDKLVRKGEVLMAVPPELEFLPEYQNIEVVKVGNLHNRMWEHISFPRYVRKQQGVALSLCNVAPLPNPGIVCIHDVMTKAMPGTVTWKFRLWYDILHNNSTRRAKKIITVSEFSKKEIMKYFGVSSERIIVIPNAWQHLNKVLFDEEALKKYGLEKGKYFFAMSTLNPNKNFRWIAEVAKRNHNSIFAVAGGINKAVFANGVGFTCPPNMKLLGYVSDEEAKTLMRDCKSFIYTSFYEGFGIPPMEALSSGAPCVIISDIEPHHEVYGDDAVYVNPFNYEVNLEDLVKPCSKGVLERFSWAKSAKLLKSMLETI